MMFLLVLLLCTGAFGASVRVNINGTEKMLYSIEEAELLFEQFILDHNKVYVNEEEKLTRLEIFKKTLHTVNDLNLKHDTIFGINQFSDMTPEEYNKIYNSGVRRPEGSMPCISVSASGLSSVRLESSLDWRQRGVVTPVKNQGSCGSCWAHSSIACLESQYAIKNGQLLDLSEQQLVDCVPKTSCAGGWVKSAGIYEIQNGIMSESDYPYVDHQGPCAADPSRVVARPSSCLQFDGSSEEDLKAALSQYGPISVSIDGDAIQNYHGGILRDCFFHKCGHAVLLVGYSDEGEPHWILKNSYGPNWGEAGYFRIPMGSRACGITNCDMSVLQM